MLLAIHITLAVISLSWTGYSWFKPSQDSLRTGWGLLALTVFTGFGLIVTGTGSLLHVCMSALIYTMVVLGGMSLARQKLQQA